MSQKAVGYSLDAGGIGIDVDCNEYVVRSTSKMAQEKKSITGVGSPPPSLRVELEINSRRVLSFRNSALQPSSK